MRKSIIPVVVLLAILINPAIVWSQQRNKKPSRPVSAAPVPPRSAAEKKYPSLLWEISGNGLKKPSYLFGTMHVSDKLAFHLGDSFYNAIKSAEVVALETNPESWQDDFSNSVFFRRSNRRNPGYAGRQKTWPSDLMEITTFSIDTYEEAIKAALAVEPSMINGMLYRTYGSQVDDFEEDTYLDMYIFQVGKKLGKRVGGVEDFEESEKLVMEAYRDMLRDRNRKKRSYDYEGMITNPKKVEDAYRKGDLDMLDSLESLTVFSDAFQEKFLYKRNEIQANSIDSIVKKSPLFVGVGAAHLPGRRGVIELLRRKGYILRPVLMDDRNSQQKESVYKIRTNYNFVTQTSDDGFYKVAIPGNKFYRFTEWNGMDVKQYADMVNGAYYVVTRIKTNSLAWGHSSDQVYKKIDSLLYENIPGKILKKTALVKDGYKGMEILNRTRRGDYQRYQVYITPFEIIVFKMSGNGDYVEEGTEARQFFGSIKLQQYTAAAWTGYHPKEGGFSIQLPHEPSMLHDNNYGTDRLEYAATDQDGNSYLVMKVNLHNFSFIEEDTFQLNLMDESFGYSAFIDQQLNRKFASVNGYPALESKFRNKDGSYCQAKYIIQGPLYYAIVARYKQENSNVKRFMESFSITPLIYPAVKERIDTTLHITVRSPVYPEPEKKAEPAIELEDLFVRVDDDDDEDAGSSSSTRKTKFIGNDTTGEKIFVSYIELPSYSFEKDSMKLWTGRYGASRLDDSTYIRKVDKQYTLADGTKCRELQITDTGSSRMIILKSFYRNGRFYNVAAITDTLTRRSSFLDNFFTSFRPADTVKGESIFTRKTEQLFKDLFSGDSASFRKSRRMLYGYRFDSLDVPALKKAITHVRWGMPEYLVLKKRFIEELGAQKDSSITTFMRDLYWKVKDTADFQHAILNGILNQRTKESFAVFKDLMLQEPPIMEDDSYEYGLDYRSTARKYVVKENGEISSLYEGRWYDLFDTLSLTKTIFPEFLQLLNVEDYREEIMNLLVVMVDSGIIKGTDYETYFSKLYLDGRQQLKKQLSKEEKEGMVKAERKDRFRPVISMPGYDMDDDDDDGSDEGNEELEKYAVLLLPFRTKTPGVQTFFEQLSKTKDRRLLYNTSMLLLRNNLPVPDSTILKFAAKDDYRADLYRDLQKMKKLDRFPSRYKNQQDIVMSILKDGRNRFDRIDTIVYLQKLPVNYKNKKGYVYFFKYKKMRDDVAWQLASVGMQPEKADSIDVDNDDFVFSEDRKLDPEKPLKEQLEKMLKELLYSKRESAADFYSARTYRIYKNYLSEMVKSRRYRD